MNPILETILGFFGRQPALPSPPKIPDSAPRIYLRDGDLDWSNIEAVRRALNGKGQIKSALHGNYVLDLGGAVLDGSKITHPKNSQSEDALGIRISMSGFSIHNGWVEDIPGGIIVDALSCYFQKLKFLKPGEDFLSTGKKGKGIFILECEFWNDRGGDKSIQLNQALMAYLRNILIVGGITGLRVQKASYNTPQVTVMANGMRFVGCECGINVDGGAVVRLSGGKFENVKKKWVSGDKQGGKVVLS
jgi:hypothetical protein